MTQYKTSGQNCLRNSAKAKGVTQPSFGAYKRCLGRLQMGVSLHSLTQPYIDYLLQSLFFATFENTVSQYWLSLALDRIDFSLCGKRDQKGPDDTSDYRLGADTVHYYYYHYYLERAGTVVHTGRWRTVCWLLICHCYNACRLWNVNGHAQLGSVALTRPSNRRLRFAQANQSGSVLGVADYVPNLTDIATPENWESVYYIIQKVWTSSN